MKLTGRIRRCSSSSRGSPSRHIHRETGQKRQAALIRGGAEDGCMLYVYKVSYISWFVLSRSRFK